MDFCEAIASTPKEELRIKSTIIYLFLQLELYDEEGLAYAVDAVYYAYTQQSDQENQILNAVAQCHGVTEETVKQGLCSFFHRQDPISAVLKMTAKLKDYDMYQ